MKRTAGFLLTVCLLAALVGCGGRTDAPPASSDYGTEAPRETVPAAEPAPSISYDARRQTLLVEGARDYAALSLPEEVKTARVLEVRDDEFTLEAYLPLLRAAGWDGQAELPGMLDRTDRSLQFLRQYLREHAKEAYPEALAAKPVRIKIDKYDLGYEAEGSQLTLRYDDGGTHREVLYLLALMDNGAVGWEQIGYAWYVGVCIDPYSELLESKPIVPGLPYYSRCIAAGVDPSNMSPADFRTVNDACAAVCFEKGLTHWGSRCESMPASTESVFTRKAAKQPGDTQLSAFMAASFLAWLDEACGFENVSLFCFGQKSFEEAFGTDYQSAFDAWSAWIRESYPSPGEPEG